MKFARVLLFITFLGLSAVIYFIMNQKGASDTTATTATDSFYREVEGKRGDDPLYSEEVRVNTALTRETQQKQAALEKQFSEQMTAFSQQTQSFKQAADEQIQVLSEKLDELKSTAFNNDSNDEDIAATVKAGISQEISGLAGSIQSLSQSLKQTTEANTEKIQALEALVQAKLLNDAPVTTPQTATVTPSKPSSSITYPYGYGQATNNKQVSAQSSDGRFNRLGEGLSEFTGQFGQRLGVKPSSSAAEQENRRVAQAGQLPTAVSAPVKEKWETVFPVYTLPPNTILSDSRLITPMIGRVPLEQNVTDPFFYKVEVGSHNLAANGHHIPGVAKIIASGYATGVREQSCVRGYIDSLTFIFVDGRIVTSGQASAEGDSAGDNIGYLADKWGKPCIRGRYINNAKDYLYSRGAAAFIEAAAEGLSQSQTSYKQNQDGSYQAILDGNVWSFVFGRGVGGTANEIAEYIRERTANAFDVVYVEQNQPVQIFLNEMIAIDYDANARKISYYDDPKPVRHYD